MAAHALPVTRLASMQAIVRCGATGLDQDCPSGWLDTPF
jgi:hypothetical protein